MQALVIVIPHVAPEREAQLALRREPRAVDQLCLQRMKERLHMRVVARGRPARGALPDAQDPEAIAERSRGILAAAITVEDEAGTGAPAADGRIEHRAGEVSVARPAEGPGEHPAGVLVQHDGQKAPPPDDGQVRNVPDPDLIGAPGDAGPEPIGMLAEEAMEPGIGAVELGHAGAQAGRTHQPRDAAPTDRPPLGAQRALQPGTPVRPVMLLEQAVNVLLQLPVLSDAGTARACPPRVVAGAGDPVERAEPRHGVLPPLRVDERERVPFCVAQNRMAFFRRACSSCSSAWARASAWSRRISRAGGTFPAGARGPRSTPSRAAFRHRDSING